jgi:hypothetical protein
MCHFTRSTPKHHTQAPHPPTNMSSANIIHQEQANHLFSMHTQRAAYAVRSLPNTNITVLRKTPERATLGFIEPPRVPLFELRYMSLILERSHPIRYRFRTRSLMLCARTGLSSVRKLVCTNIQLRYAL